MNRASFEACIFDFDGVIANPESWQARAKRLTFEADVFARFKGCSDRDFFAHFATPNAKLNLETMLEQKRASYSSS